MVGGPQLGQDTIKQLKFSGRTIQVRAEQKKLNEKRKDNVRENTTYPQENQDKNKKV